MADAEPPQSLSERDAAICASYREKPVVAAVARAHGVSTTIVKNVLARAGLRKKPKSAAPSDYRHVVRAYSQADPSTLPRVYRDPCWRCGARWDLGCEHRKPIT